MSFDVKFEELGIPERTLLLRAFDYDVDEEGFILDPTGSKIRSAEIHYKFLKVEDVMIAPGSLQILDGTPTSISKYLREKVEVPA